MEVIDVRNKPIEERFPVIFEKLKEVEEMDVIIEVEPKPLIKRLKDEGYRVKVVEEGDHIRLEIRKPEIVPGRCPGAETIIRPKLQIVKCPNCGAELERWTDEIKSICENCGKEVVFEIDSCIQWCEYARQCVGDERYEEIIKTLEEAEKEPIPNVRKYIKSNG